MRRRSPGEPEAQRGLSRREFVARGAALGSAALLSGPLAACGRSQLPPVVVVGAGLAGLTCAYRLHQHGVEAAVYEARPDRVGGRCWTAREFADGQIAEHGGEFIDSGHARIRALARELGLHLEDREAWAKRRRGATRGSISTGPYALRTRSSGTTQPHCGACGRSPGEPGTSAATRAATRERSTS